MPLVLAVAASGLDAPAHVVVSAPAAPPSAILLVVTPASIASPAGHAVARVLAAVSDTFVVVLVAPPECIADGCTRAQAAELARRLTTLLVVLEERQGVAFTRRHLVGVSVAASALTTALPDLTAFTRIGLIDASGGSASAIDGCARVVLEAGPSHRSMRELFDSLPARARNTARYREVEHTDPLDPDALREFLEWFWADPDEDLAQPRVRSPRVRGR